VSRRGFVERLGTYRVRRSGSPEEDALNVRTLLPVVLVGIALSACAAPSRLRPADRQLIAGRTFVVTGASSGFGRGVALKLAAHGGNVVLAARRTEVLEEVAAQARAAGGTPLVVVTDVGKPDDVERLAQAATARFGRIDVWINNAGVGAIGPFEAIPIADHERVVDVNFKGVIYGSHAALRRFRTQGHGTLVNIASVEGEIALPYHSTYAATKHAVVGLGAALHQELRLSKARRIKVSTVLPWAADTPYFQHTANYSGGTPRMVAMDGPEKVVDAIVWTAIHPRKRVAVGWKAKGAVTAHQLFPGLTEHVAGNITHGVQIETAPPAPPTSGTLHEPMREGTGVEGGIRQRMEREDRERRVRKSR
jgi:short-subunit dehydrogenase